MWVVPTSHISSGSTNSDLQAGIGPNCPFRTSTRVASPAKSSSSGCDEAMEALDSSRTSRRKSKPGGGGLTEALKGPMVLGVCRAGRGVKTGKVDPRMVSMDARKDLLPHPTDGERKRERSLVVVVLPWLLIIRIGRLT